MVFGEDNVGRGDDDFTAEADAAGEKVFVAVLRPPTVLKGVVERLEKTLDNGGGASSGRAGGGSSGTGGGKDDGKGGGGAEGKAGAAIVSTRSFRLLVGRRRAAAPFGRLRVEWRKRSPAATSSSGSDI